MTGRRKTEIQFEARPSGVLVPSAAVTSLSSEKGTTYLAVKEKALSLEALFESHQLSIRRNNSLSRFIADAKTLSDEWFCSRNKDLPAQLLFSAIQLDKISTSVLAAADDPEIPKLLRKLLDGSADCLCRDRTPAKDMLWELDTYLMLKIHGLKVQIGEPDVVATVGNEKIGIACKKIYSEANFAKTISGAVSQIEGAGMMGLVAVNLDDMLPEDTILQGPSLKAISRTLSQRNDAFMLAHEHTLQRYLPEGRSLAVFVSSAVIADVPRARRRFYNARETTVWYVPSLPHQKAEKMEQLLASFNAIYRA